ncbi:unnamed protein product, partial [Iphiclides podalirius]
MSTFGVHGLDLKYPRPRRAVEEPPVKQPQQATFTVTKREIGVTNVCKNWISEMRLSEMPSNCNGTCQHYTDPT